ncbi:MAG: hypothetical protein J0I41_16030 [Filimonas sp.]|nr:hypothetical protein [Filimonas sp.]
MTLPTKTLNINIPFELHITVDRLKTESIEHFTKLCAQIEAKPLLIQLSQGDSVEQPMISKIILDNNFDNVLKLASSYSSILRKASYNVKRLKIEVPSMNAHLFENFTTSFRKYYEWHAKVNYDHVSLLLQICDTHKAHLSLNALKNSEATRFITVREFGGKEFFDKRVNDLKEELQSEGWNITKEQAEYCIYDNNEFLDNGWLPQ